MKFYVFKTVHLDRVIKTFKEKNEWKHEWILSTSDNNKMFIKQKKNFKIISKSNNVDLIKVTSVLTTAEIMFSQVLSRIGIQCKDFL